jgi:CofD-related protein of GAK system
MARSLETAAGTVLTGLVVIFAALFAVGADPEQTASRLGGGFFSVGTVVAGAYFLGFLVETSAVGFCRPLRLGAERTALRRLGVPQLDFAEAVAQTRSRAARVEQQEAAIRLAGNVAVSALLVLLLAFWKGRPAVAWLLAPVAAIGAFTVRTESMRLVVTVMQLRRTRRRGRGKERGHPAPPDRPAPLSDGVSVGVLVFAGGTAFRNCNIALARRGHHVTRIVPAWDNGGSSRALREAFGVLSIGDIRQALMTMAHGENNSNEVIRLFNWRLSEDATDEQLLAELESFVREDHPRIAKVPTDLRNVIRRYLETFWSARPEGLPLRNGSIGNFVLLGAFLAHGRDMNTAIFVFRQLCGIQGHVWPVALPGDLHLCGRLENGEVIVGEEQVTEIDRGSETSRIETTYLVQGKDGERHPAAAAANPLVLSAFADADVIVFGPGSFFTSVLPHLRVAGVVDALAGSDKPKLFVGNMREGNECYGWSLADLVAKFLATCHQYADEERPATCYLTHIVAHDSATHQRGVRGDRFMAPGDVETLRAQGIEVWFGDLEDPWKRGHHDGNALAQRLIDCRTVD